MPDNTTLTEKIDEFWKKINDKLKQVPFFISDATKQEELIVNIMKQYEEKVANVQADQKFREEQIAKRSSTTATNNAINNNDTQK